MLNIRIQTNIRSECKNVLYIINRLSPHGEGQVASKVGRECCFWRAACFCSEVIAWNGRSVQSFPLKAHYSEILSRGRGEMERAGGRGHEHTVFSEEMTSQLSFAAASSLHPDSPQLH